MKVMVEDVAFQLAELFDTLGAYDEVGAEKINSVITKSQMRFPKLPMILRPW